MSTLTTTKTKFQIFFFYFNNIVNGFNFKINGNINEYNKIMIITISTYYR